MDQIFFILMLVAMLAVVGSLFVGIIGMARGGDFNARHANRVMRYRVILQGVALALFALAMLSGGG
ncbi:MAG TPA: twin transmembrane helix small protein [Arenibaculum sp.]|nr:twin transmembrane helix small protein [Arenibaculum sp.]